jgi:hypothetical protein
MIDAETIKHMIRKRINPVLGTGFAGFGKLLAETVHTFKDGVGLGICIDVAHVAYGLTYRAPRSIDRDDVLRACDYFEHAIKRIRSNPLSSPSWRGEVPQ